ncbi:MAG: hypothetical protein ACLQVM_14750 [Terriglobia bacterium]
MYLKIGRPSRTVLVVLACGFLWARSAGAQSPPSNLGPLKGEMKVFEAVIDGTMSQVFAPPFGVLQKTLGTYLPGFGLAFSLEVNLRPMPIATPFNTRPLSKAELEETQKTKLERIETIKRSVPRLLADHASSLRDLASDDHVAVVVHLFRLGAGYDGLPGQLVIETRKSDLNQFWDKQITYQQLVAKMTTLEL